MVSTTDSLHDHDRTAAQGARKQSRRRWLRLLLMVVLPLVLILGGTWWYLTSGRYVSTDDAYVQANAVAVSADVAGRVVEVDVHDNQLVHKGDLLLKLDDRPYRIAVERARAELANARLQVEGLRATYRQRQADLKAAQDTLVFQQRQLDRQQQLVGSHVVSQASFDQARHNFDAARQQVASTEQQIANVLASLGGNPNIPTDQHPLVQQAQAQLDQSLLNLSYTEIHAPADGIVTKVETTPAGTYLAASSPAFSLISTDEVWVEANYKETDLTRMKPGQEATFTVDAYPGDTFRGRVASLSPGTGSEFSVLPPQNATGNWVKVVQRLPVRIVVETPDPDKPLRAGMSVTVDVDTHYVNPTVASVESFFGRAKAAGGNRS
jgi:membrane fusion protein (multidrug efflux system)